MRINFLLIAWHPEPEGGAFALAVAVDTDLSTAAFGDGLTDGEPHACALHKLIELEELFEYQRLLVSWDALAGILAIKVKTVVFGLPSEADMPLGGKLHGIGYEVGKHLLDTSDVDGGGEVVKGTVFLELHVGILYALSPKAMAKSVSSGLMGKAP